MSRPVAGAPRHPRDAALYALCVGFFMICLDATVVNVAIPAIGATFSAGLNELVWVNSAYALCYAAPLIVAARLGDRFGPKRIFLIGLGGFTAASLACAIAPTVELLIAARALQGLSAALIAPQTMTLIVHIFPTHVSGRALGIWGAAGGAAMAAGPLVGGLLAGTVGWRAIFLLNVPIGIIGSIVAHRVVPERKELHEHHFDPLGVVLSSLGLGALIFAVQSGGSFDRGVIAGPITVTMVAVVAAISLVAFTVWQYLNPREPLLPLRLFGSRNFTAACAAAGAMGAAMGGLFLPLMIYLQDSLGVSAAAAGLATVPMFVASALSARYVGRLTDRMRPGLLAGAGFISSAIGLAWLAALLGPEMALWSTVPALIACGIGVGTVSAPLAAIATRDLDPESVGAGAGVFGTARQLGGALGSAATGALLQASIGPSLTTATQAALLFPIAMVLFGAACCVAMRR